MKFLKINERELPNLFFAIIIFFLIFIGILSFKLLDYSSRLKQLENTRYKLFSLGIELKESSDDLTKFCRTYMITGESIWEQKYWELLDIRNGIKPRPDGNTIALHDSLLKIGISREEDEKLLLAEKNSNTLVWTEKVAFHAMKGLFADASKKFTIKNKPDTIFARNIIFSHKYMADKEKIMQPIAEFRSMLDNRISSSIEKQKTKNNILIVVIILIIVIIMLLSFYAILVLRKKMVLQTIELIEKNNNITDSIVYAKRIQEAKLPSKELIYSSLPNSFVLYKPKAIVSGDFYFFSKNKQSVYLASADCTGHGVPGAIMSMIGSEKLEDSLAYHTDPSDILSHLNVGIKASLNQTDSNDSTHDGMDIALCSIDINERIVKYSGANRPFWLIRNGQTVIEEIKPTKKAIGGFTDNDQYFASHEIQLQQGDTFYLSTDGYADTFGGQTGKKLMTTKFKEILLSIQSKSMHEQEVHLDNFIENWKNGMEQIDDILIIGVRL